MKKGLIVGLTGGIASGKSTVAKIFKSLGAEVIDADRIAHQVLKTDTSVHRRIVDAFGDNILDENGEIDRSKLGCVVFNDPELLNTLNEIVHPAVIEGIRSEADKRLSTGKCKILVAEIVLLIERNLTCTVDFVVLVHADKGIQLKRAMGRGLSGEDVLKRLRAQMSSDEKIPYADYVIYNSGSMSDTIRQTKAVWESLNSKLYTDRPK
jgi:dephospho-CoA kinase